MPVKNYLLIIACLFGLSTDLAQGKANTMAESRADFLLAEKAIIAKNDKTYFILANSLKKYPLYPYLQYQWLSHHLEKGKAIQVFLLNNRHTRYAALLKHKWLRYLAKKKDWTQLIKHYRTSSSAELQCYYYLAKFNASQKKLALTAAKKLWIVGKSQPEACNPLFKHLISSKYLTRDMLWQRFQAALDKNRVVLAKYIQSLMNVPDQKVAALWLKVHQKPERIGQTNIRNHHYKQAGLIFAHAVDRMARNNIAHAIAIWDSQKKDFVIPQYRSQKIERRLALALAFGHDQNAYNRLQQLKKSDATVREWQIRAALNEQNWSHVEKALIQLTSKEKKNTGWQYWQARMYNETGKPGLARKIYQRLAKDRSFYGFISAHRLNKGIDIGDHPLSIPNEAIYKLAQQTDFQVVKELIAVNKNQEAKRQWWYAVSQLPKKEIMVASKLAQQWQWNQVAIFTIAKAKYWDDINLRFPLKYSQQVKFNAKIRALDPAIVFGLIRRESAFNEKARSPVGARGLMQIMPKTGKQIARALKEKWLAKNSLFNPDLNLKYGTYYYQQLLKQFNGHYALAAAAYNAGPHRIIRWLPKKQVVPADIWIETIPFKETRAYVSAVLTYALIYQQRLHRNVLKIKDFLREIHPG